MKTALPRQSILNQNRIVYDYVDSYEEAFRQATVNITPTVVCKAFFTSAPSWVSKLMHLRDKIVSLIGLKTSGNADNREQLLERFTGEQGERLGLFKVYDKNDNEIIIGEDDKHLNFRVSLYLDRGESSQMANKLIVSTTVQFNHWIGRLYFVPVRPFHRLIVPTMTRGIVKEIEKYGYAK
jgi:hypothetical protein